MKVKVRGPVRRSCRSQQGYVLLIILLLMFLLMVSLVSVAPRIRQEIQRQREEETIHRGQQYVRAIQRFYKKFGRYPNSLDELESTNNLRFLRRRYTDPLTADGSWRIIHFGEAKVIPKQLQAMAGATVGPGSPGNLGTPASSAFGASPGAGTSGGAVLTNGNPASQLSPGYGSQADSALSGGSATSAFGPSTPGAQGATPGAQTASPGAPGTPGTPVSSMGTLTGRTFGGSAIVGIAPNSNDQSIKELNGRDHYNEWEFVYDPRLELLRMGQGQQPGQPGASFPQTLGNMGGFGSMQQPPQQQQISPGVNPR